MSDLTALLTVGIELNHRLADAMGIPEGCCGVSGFDEVQDEESDRDLIRLLRAVADFREAMLEEGYAAVRPLFPALVLSRLDVSKVD